MTDLSALAAALSSERFAHTALADGTGVVLDIQGEQVLTLNESSEFLVAAMLGGCSDEGELVARLIKRYAVDSPQAQRDLAAFLTGLQKQIFVR